MHSGMYDISILRRIEEQHMKKFGFGGMRFPLTDKDNPKSIDLTQVEQMVDCFLENGFTYFDTAFPYHNGLSEEAFRETLVKRHARECFVLADKMPIFMIKKSEEYEQTFQTQLERCGVEYFDYYLLHNLGNAHSPKAKNWEALTFYGS
jgi:predicted aldo/keto reductase-like oxidoreductase